MSFETVKSIYNFKHSSTGNWFPRSQFHFLKEMLAISFLIDFNLNTKSDFSLVTPRRFFPSKYDHVAQTKLFFNQNLTFHQKYTQRNSQRNLIMY